MGYKKTVNLFSSICAFLLNAMKILRPEEARRRRTEENYRRIFEIAPHVMIGVDRQGKIVMVNRRSEAVFGYSRNELIGKKVELLVPKRFRASHPAHRDSFFADPKARMLGEGACLYALCKDGREIPIEIGISLMENTDMGDLAIASIADFTERKQLEEMKNQFVSTVSHELRTPLSVIQLGIQNLKAEGIGALTGKQLEIIDRSERSAIRLRKLIEDILDLSRLESGRTKLAKKQTNLKHLIYDVIFGIKAKEGGGISIVEEVSDDIPDIMADPDLVAQVVTNLLDNALRYAASKVIVSVEAATDSKNNRRFVQTKTHYYH